MWIRRKDFEDLKENVERLELQYYKSKSGRIEEKEKWTVVEEHICQSASEVIIRRVGDTFHFDLSRSMIADGGAKHVDSVRIPLIFCPFCGEQLVKEVVREKRERVTKESDRRGFSFDGWVELEDMRMREDETTAEHKKRTGEE